MEVYYPFSILENTHEVHLILIKANSSTNDIMQTKLWKSLILCCVLYADIYIIMFNVLCP